MVQSPTIRDLPPSPLPTLSVDRNWQGYLCPLAVLPQVYADVDTRERNCSPWGDSYDARREGPLDAFGIDQRANLTTRFASPRNFARGGGRDHHFGGGIGRA